MTDRRDHSPDPLDENGDATRPAAQEGVRILGAEEAAAALEGGQVARRLDDDAPRFGDVPPRPDPSVRPAARFPRSGGDAGAETGIPASGDDDPARRPRVSSDSDPDGVGRPGDDDSSADTVIDVRGIEGDPSSTETSGPMSLPHWTEPPTGEVPIILPEAEVVDHPDQPVDEDLEAWGSASGGAPRFRSGAGDWAEADFAAADELKGDALGLGAISADADDDAEFEDRVAQRRRRRLRVRGAREAPPPGSTTGSRRTPVRASSDPSTPGPTPDSTPGPTPGSTPGPEGSVADAEPSDVAAPAGSDLTTRIITGVAIGVAALVALRLGRGATAVLAAVVIGFASFELFEALRKRGFHPATILGLVAAVTTPLAAYKVGEAAFPLMLALVVVFSLLWYLFDVVQARAVVSVAVTVLVYVYVGALGGFAGLLLGYPDGVGLILGVVICVVAYDVFGYLVGSQFGKTPLAQHISPNKTLEGLLGGMTASILFAALVVNRITPWTDLGHALSLGVVVAIMAPLGDLCESMLKRDLNLKDFGSILPGHGGILDRFDALLFCLPAVYYLARYLKIG